MMGVVKEGATRLWLCEPLHLSWVRMADRAVMSIIHMGAVLSLEYSQACLEKA